MSTDIWLPDLPVVRVFLTAVAQNDLHLPPFTGSMLRGAFGHALKHLVCITEHKSCTRCPLYRSCAYPQVFQPPSPPGVGSGLRQMPVPYVVEPPPLNHPGRYDNGQHFEFSMVLVGPAIQHLNLIISAWRNALGTGLGPRRYQLALKHVRDEKGRLLYDSQQGTTGTAPEQYSFKPLSGALGGLTLNFQTPLNLRRKGRELDGESVDPYALLTAMMRRAINFAAPLAGSRNRPDYSRLAAHAKTVVGKKQLSTKMWNRKSSRQKTRMPMGGLVGSWQLHGELDEFWPFIHLGQWLHVGKKCSFGLGRYNIEEKTA